MRLRFSKTTFQTVTIKEVQCITNRPLFFFSYKVLLSQIKFFFFFFFKSSSNTFITKYTIKVDICLKATPKPAGPWFPARQKCPRQRSPWRAGSRRCCSGQGGFQSCGTQNSIPALRLRAALPSQEHLCSRLLQRQRSSVRHLCSKRYFVMRKLPGL